MRELLHALFSWVEFMPHGHCYLWKPGLVWLEVLSNASIGLSYVAISATLAYVVWRLRELPFQWVYVAFGVFIVSCGATHFFDILTVWTPLYWLDGTLRAVTAIASVGTAVALVPLVPQLSELVRAARAGRELERLKTQFFANVSHELRTPLTLILGPTEKLLTDRKLDSAQRASVELIERNARLLLKHVNDLLDVSKLEAGKMLLGYGRADVAALVRFVVGCFEGVASDKRLTFVVEAPDKLSAEIDVHKLQRIVTNLVANACKFTPVGGHIRCALEASGPRLVLEVADSGPGIRPDERALVFERFRQLDGSATRTAGGTGLGLAIARDFAVMHGGNIAVGDAAEGGASFVLDLPLRAPAGTALADGDESGHDDTITQSAAELRALTAAVSRVVDVGARPRVLVVEDNPELNRFIADTLAGDYEVERAFDGAEGLARAVERPPDLVLTDVMMPRLSGDQLVLEMRARPELDAVPIVVLTAKSDDALRVRLLQAGAQDYLTKPFGLEELRARVGNQVTMKRARDLLQRELDAQERDLERLAVEVTSRKHELQAALETTREAREQAEHASRAKSDFLSMVSHELRTPLTTLRIQVDRLARDPSLATSERHQRIVHHLGESSNRLERLIESLLYYARAEKAPMEAQLDPIDVPDLLNKVMDELRPQAETNGLVLALDLEPIPAVISDVRFVRMIVSNLVGNAVKFTEQGEVRVRARWSEDRLFLAVADTGPGIAPADQARVFEPFEHVEPVAAKHTPGFGLGLALVKQMLQALGGRIALDAELGRGSTFTVELPAVQARTLAKEPTT